MSRTSARRIAVFGSSEPRAGHPEYELARELGRELAAAGMEVVTGGYGGVMEAASRGASEAGGRAIGVGCAIFSDRETNPYLDEVTIAADLHDRTRDLIELADGFVVLPGRSGTLAELTMLWALDRAGCLGPRLVVLLSDSWSALAESLAGAEILEPSQRRITVRAASPREATALLARAALDRPGESGGGS